MYRQVNKSQHTHSDKVQAKTPIETKIQTRKACHCIFFFVCEGPCTYNSSKCDKNPKSMYTVCPRCNYASIKRFDDLHVIM